MSSSALNNSEPHKLDTSLTNQIAAEELDTTVAWSLVIIAYGDLATSVNKSQQELDTLVARSLVIIASRDRATTVDKSRGIEYFRRLVLGYLLGKRQGYDETQIPVI